MPSPRAASESPQQAPTSLLTPPSATARIELRVVGAPGEPGYLLTGSSHGAPVHLAPTPFATTADVAGIGKAVDSSGQATIQVDFKPQSSERIEDFTHDMVGRQIAILVDGEVVSTATLAGPFGDSMQITGIGGLREQQQLFDRLTRH